MTITTGFEDNIAASQDPPAWTSLGQEVAFLEALASEYGTVALDIADVSVQGRPITMARVGHPVAPTRYQAQRMPCVLVIGTQHGNEPGSREGILKYIRTLASATGELAEYLESVCWVFVPTINPDGFVASTRGNANGTNLNRDHIALAEPETRAIHRLIRDYQPRLIIDCHEAGLATEIQYGRTNHAAAHTAVKAISNTLALDYIAAKAIDLGYTHGVYGDGTEQWLASLIGLRHSVGMILETSQIYSRPERAQYPFDMLSAVQAFDEENAAAIEAAISASKADKIAEGAAGTTPFNTGSTTINPPPLGYELAPEDIEAISEHIALFGIEQIAPGVISMAQEAQPLIPLIVDAAADYPTVSATRIMSSVPPPAIENLAVSANVPSASCNESEGAVHYITVAAGGPKLMPQDIAQLIEHGAIA